MLFTLGIEIYRNSSDEVLSNEIMQENNINENVEPGSTEIGTIIGTITGFFTVIGNFVLIDALGKIFINISKTTGFVINLVYNGDKLNKQILNLTSAFFALISYKTGIFILLNKVDINSYTDPDVNMSDFFGLKTGKIITDKTGNISVLKNLFNQDEDYEDVDICPGIQYVK